MNPAQRRAEQTDMPWLCLEWSIFWGQRELSWPYTVSSFAIFTCSYFGCHNQLQTNLIQGTRGGKHLSFQVQWSGGLWLTANMFTARRKGPTEQARHLLWEWKEGIMLGHKGRQTQALGRQRSQLSRQDSKPTPVFSAFSLGIRKFCQDTEQLKVICHASDSTRSRHWDRLGDTFYLDSKGKHPWIWER